MTDTSSVAVTNSTTDNPYPVTATLPSPVLNGAISDSVVPEEEPYTIKCICAFADDDGNTVFCERCETWQHIECYYHGRNVPDVHNCVDCEPRPLDAKRATERQRQRRVREQGDGSGDRKPKRPGAKSQKRKTKDPHDQPNGYHHHHHHHHQRSESGARDQPPSKKTKTNHRSSVSVGSLPGSFSLLPPDTARKRGSVSSHPQSPTKPPGPVIPMYSNEFLHLYHDRDQGHADMDSNLFVSLPLAADLASWVTDATALSRVTNGRSAREIFTWSDAAMDRSRWPALSTELVTDNAVEFDGLHPTWKVLKTRDTVHRDGIVGEIKGKIGLLRDYCLDPGNSWQELRHPEPFVFFHPQLPIYIDSRQEGSLLRYVRRSCRPNVTMKTYITNEVEYHFCFVAKDDIPADTEITAMWYLDPQLFESPNGFVKQESSDSAQDVAAVCLSNVLSHFGGCACASDPPQHCLLSNIDRRRPPRSAADPSSKHANGRRRKAKSKSAMSPAETVGATNSRAGSEGMLRNVDDYDQDDSRSSSGSAHGRGRSRDPTPMLQTSNDLTFPDSELSARDKRKIAAVEKKFQQLEQGQQAFQRKKKRSSGGHSVQATPTADLAGGSMQQGGYFGNHGAPPSNSVNVETALGQLQSPLSAISPSSVPKAFRRASRKMSDSSRRTAQSPPGRRKYVDSAMQTDPDENDVQFLASPQPPSPRRPAFASLTQRLLKRCQADRVKLEEVHRQPTLSIDQLRNSVHSPISSNVAGAHHETSSGISNDNNYKRDMDMKDDANVTPPGKISRRQSQGSRDGLESISPESRQGSSMKPPLPPPWPSTVAHYTRIPGDGANGVHADLHIPLPPTTMPMSPSATSPGSSVTTALQSPLSTDVPTPSQPGSQVPGSNATAPSPVKKKLSLGDYLIRRGTLPTPTSEKPPSQPNAMPPPQKSPSQSQISGSPSSSSAAANNRQIEEKPVHADGTKRDDSTSDVQMNDTTERTRSSNLASVSS